MRSIPDAGDFSGDLGIDDDGGATSECAGLAMFRAPVTPITVTFPGYNTPTVTIHVVTPTASCDMPVDTTEDSVLFVSDASACALLLAPGNPGQSSATASGPNDLLFLWNYGDLCQIQDDYALSKK
jgi:hypothetical protein